MFFVRAEHDVHQLWRHTLHALDLLAVERELEHITRLATASELRVPRLVSPRTERGQLGNSNEEVSDSAPRVVLEHRLVDDVHARTHRGLGRVRCSGPVVALRDLDNRFPLRAEPLEPRALVVHALAPQQLQLLVVSTRCD